jgi:transcriptional regulator
MHIPHQYRNENLDEVKGFLKNNSFGILVNQVDGKPWATHIPLELAIDENGKDILVGHIAKANPQGSSFKNEQEVLCIFNGPHSYVSSSWYKKEDVPTWNYVAVHIYGTIKILDEEAVLASLHKLVDKYEAHSKNPISVDDLSKNTMRQLKGIIGFQITINEIQAAYKLSQGRANDHRRIIEELEKTEDSGSKEIAKLMKTKSP